MDIKDCEEFLSRLNQQRIDAEGCDVNLVSLRDGKEFMAHWNVLTAASPHFKRVFQSDFKETIVGKIELDMGGDIIEILLKYMYTYDIEIDESIASRLFPEAAYLQLNRLKERCAKFLLANVTPSNCIEVWSLASLHSCEEMKALAWKMMCHNFDSIIDSHEFLGLDKMVLITVLADKSLRCRESSVFSGVCNWVRADSENRKQHMKELLSLVRLSCLEKYYLLNTVGSEPLVTDDKECFQIYIDSIKTIMMTAPDLSCNRGMALKASGPWKDGPPLTVEMNNCSCVVFGTEIYAASKKMAVLSQGTWRLISPPSDDPVWKLCVVADSMYAIGVVSRNRNVYKFEKESETWTLVHSAVGKNGGIVSATVFDDRICVADQSTRTIETFDLSHAESGFVRLCAFPAGLDDNFPLCAVDGRLMTVGGKPYTNQVNVFDPHTDSWKNEASLDKNLAYIAATAFDGRPVIAGGFNGEQNKMAKMLLKGVWTPLPSLQSGRSGSDIVLLGKTLYVIGGYGYAASSFVEMLRLEEE